MRTARTRSPGRGGRGFVDSYDLQGHLLTRVDGHGQFDAPWGLAHAPDTFGRYAGDLLVGNFGNGEINAYEELDNGHFEHRGTLRDADGEKLAIDGLWALEFGNVPPAAPCGFTRVSQRPECTFRATPSAAPAASTIRVVGPRRGRPSCTD